MRTIAGTTRQYELNLKVSGVDDLSAFEDLDHGVRIDDLSGAWKLPRRSGFG